MREMFGRLSTVNKVGLIGAFVGYAIGMAAVIIADPVAGIIITVASTALVIFCLWFFFGREVSGNRIRATGVPAEATILSVRSTGKTINEVYPEIELQLEVRPGDGEPYRTKTRCLVDQVEIPSFQPGNVIGVMVDSKHRKKVAVQRA